MINKQIKIALLFALMVLSVSAQRSCLSFEYHFTNYKKTNSITHNNGLLEKMNQCYDSHIGGSIQFPIGYNNMIGIGVGLKKVNYQKDWIGIFPENNQFGIVTVDGQMNYWSFPINYTLNKVIKYRIRRGCIRVRQSFNRVGLSITYIPSFQGQNSYSFNTYSVLPLNEFTYSYNTNEQQFQHAINIGICNYFPLFEGSAIAEAEPFFGIGTGYFKDSGTRFNNISFGVKFRIGFSFSMPHIGFEKTSTSTSSQEKINQLKEKQKEIEEQLNNKPQN